MLWLTHFQIAVWRLSNWVLVEKYWNMNDFVLFKLQNLRSLLCKTTKRSFFPPSSRHTDSSSTQNSWNLMHVELYQTNDNNNNYWPRWLLVVNSV